MYGGIKQDNKIVFVNAVGLVLMVAYVIVFYKYAYKRRDLQRHIFICVLFGMLILGYLSNEEDNQRLQNIIGRYIPN